MSTREQIIKDFSELNEDAESRWEDEKILQLCDYKEDGDITRLTIGIGKWDTTYHDLVVDEEGISVEKESEKNELLDTVIHYFLNPIFFGS